MAGQKKRKTEDQLSQNPNTKKARDRKANLSAEQNEVEKARHNLKQQIKRKTQNWVAANPQATPTEVEDQQQLFTEQTETQ